MKVSASTKISKIIKDNKDAIEVIASINPHFKKLKNPILRRVLAPRVTVAEASKIGGVAIEVFLEKLEEAGFEIENTVQEAVSEEKKPKMNKENIVSFDVREIIASGTDPFKQIMEKVKDLKENETLEIINSFEPIPLINVLKSKGFKAEVERKEHLVYTYFQKKVKAEISTDGVTCKTSQTFDSVYKQFIGKMEYVDVRHLEMPEPMTNILGKLEALKPAYCLLVDHKKIPQFLLPELENRNFDILYNKKSENHIQLLIFRKNEHIKHK